MELAELLQWLSSALKTGTLVVDNGKVEKQIVFRDGKLISSSSSDPSEVPSAVARTAMSRDARVSAASGIPTPKNRRTNHARPVMTASASNTVACEEKYIPCPILDAGGRRGSCDRREHDEVRLC